MTVKEFADESLRTNQDIILTSLDVKGAFNAAWWPAIISALKEMNCPKNLFKLTLDYFNERKAILQQNDITIVREVTKGCPQGSCCGPGFWNILYNSLLSIEYHKNSKVIAFADDLLLLSKGRSSLEAETTANYDLYKIANWARENKMQFNQDKSKVMLISKKRATKNTKIQIYLRNELLEQVQWLKYLGVYIDNKFNFDKHVHIVSTKCVQMINILSRSAKISWGLSQRALETIYHGAVVPIMTYAAPAWHMAARREKNKRKIRRVQRLMNIKIIRAFRTISYEASCILSGILPLELKIEAEVTNYIQLKSEETFPRNTQHCVNRNRIKIETLKNYEIQWQDMWQTTPKGELTRSFFPTIASRMKVKIPPSPTIITLLSGHGKLKNYFYRFKICDDTICKCGIEAQSVDHVIFVCPTYNEDRKILENAVRTEGHNWPATKTDLIQWNYSAFMKFLKNIDLDLIQ